MADPIALSVVVMHHPRRRDFIPKLLAACRPLPVRVVVDPDPDGPPSPLRTAKRAWAAIAPGATHHVVLQDDILPMKGFATHLRRALAARPDHGITLSVQQTSPRNSYAVRRAALSGQAFAVMSSVEWTPTLALALPVGHAEALARFLAAVPDDHVDDDTLVTAFCAERGLPVLATVPNLVEHADVESLSVYADEGRRPVTVYGNGWRIPRNWWEHAGQGPLCPPEGCGGGLTVDLRESRCGIRLLSPGTDEPVEHPFTWEWRDHAELAGVPALEVVATAEAALAGGDLDAGVLPSLRALPPALTLEVWAAGFLLGAGLAATGAAIGVRGAGADAAHLGALLRRRAVRSWLEVGLARRDRRSLPPAAWAALIEFTLLACATGAQHAPRAGVPGIGDSAGRSDVSELGTVLRRLARREVDSLLMRPHLTRWVTQPVAQVSVRPTPCLWCGTPAAAADLDGLAAMEEVRVLRPDESPAPGSVTLRALACEWLTARSVLPLVRGLQDGRPDLPRVVSTRAAAAAEIVAAAPGTSLPELLSEVDARECWMPCADEPPADRSTGACAVLPASARLAPSAAPTCCDTVGSYVLTPHPLPGEPAGLHDEYRRHREEAYARLRMRSAA